MSKCDSKNISYQFKKIDVMHKLCKLITENGGNLWKKNGRERVYFGCDADLFVASKVYTQSYDAYIDLNDNTFNARVNALDFDSDKNNYTVEDYKNAYIDYIMYMTKKN